MSADRIDETKTFDASPDEVIDAITLWGDSPASEMDGAEILEGDRGESATVKYRLSAFGKTIDYVVRYEVARPERVTLDLVESGLLKAMSGQYALSESNGKTACRFELEVEPAFRVPGMIKRTVAKKIVQGALDDIDRELANAR